MAPRKPRSQSDKIQDLKAGGNAPAPERKDDGLPTNNLQAMREAEEKGLHKLLAEVRPLLNAVDAAASIVKEKRDLVNKRLDQGVADGYPKGLVRKMLKETAVTGDRKNQREEWEMEVRFRQYVGLPALTQSDLEERVPDAARDEIDWIGDGYSAGLRGDACDPKGHQVPDRFHQKWMEAWGEGQTKLALSLGKPARPAPTLGVIDGGKGQDLGSETLAAIGEAEPEIVAQVQDDHGDDGDGLQEDADADPGVVDDANVNGGAESEPV